MIGSTVELYSEIFCMEERCPEKESIEASSFGEGDHGEV